MRIGYAFCKIFFVRFSLFFVILKIRIKIYMKSKKYIGICGALKILCATFIGLIVGGLAMYYYNSAIPRMSARDCIEIVNMLILIFAISGYIGILFSGIYQVVSIFRPIKVNKAVAFCIDILALIFIAKAGSDFIYFSSAFDIDGMVVFSTILYWLSLIIILVDATVLLKKIKKENIKIFTEYNCMELLRRTSIIVTPLLIIGLILAFGSVIENNYDTMKMNETFKGGFDSFVMRDFDGNEYTEDMLKGHKVTMINIWGTFCGPCIREMPELEEISEMYNEKDLKIIGLPGDLRGADGVVDEDLVAKALDIIDKTGAKYTMLIPSMEIETGVIRNVRFYPTTIFVDENGEHLKFVEGAKSKEVWIEIIDEVIANEK